MEKNKVEGNEKIYYGGIAILYTRKDGELKFLVVENTETKNISFVSGAREDDEKNDTEAIKRELGEELGSITNNIKLTQTEAKQDFIFGPKKKERAGHRGMYTAFLGDVTNIADKIRHTEELSGMAWLNKEEVLSRLTFADLKEVFIKATGNLK